ncbi:FAD-dependent oxidoreductase [Psychrobacter sp. JCM 18903]|uniref:FAD-dependent oxidoreductase n=1 Tax=Psychrobacter sp. JCM 18903 TaxID=1298610 RepID=UPI0004B9702E|nr:FAD-dependent oxidoreductase [Psychrobacter sp. JCM 18903]
MNQANQHDQYQQRQQALAPLSRRSSQVVPWDILIIGGGITGAGIAREAARRGLAVLLIEQKDFAWGTSSRSSKMVHGGLRYIASGDYKTTLLSVRERERMLSEASGLVNEMHYVMPHYKASFHRHGYSIPCYVSTMGSRASATLNTLKKTLFYSLIRTSSKKNFWAPVNLAMQ